MITFFTTGKPFKGHDGIIQRNALQSWKLLHPDVEVILFGDEEGAAEVCAEYGIRHEPQVERHELGMPYVDQMFARAQEIARNDYLCYANCDMIFVADFRTALEKARAWRKRFLLVAQRWETEVTALIDFKHEQWAGDLKRRALTSGYLQPPDYVDFFLFSKGLYDDVPPLVVGRSYWDNWMIWKSLADGAPVIDGTQFLVAMHQRHDYGHHPQGKQGTHTDAGAMLNFELAGKGRYLRSMLDSTHRITRSGGIRRTRFRRQLESVPVLRVRQVIAERTFWLRNRLGLRRQARADSLVCEDGEVSEGS